MPFDSLQTLSLSRRFWTALEFSVLVVRCNFLSENVVHIRAAQLTLIRVAGWHSLVVSLKVQEFLLRMWVSGVIVRLFEPEGFSNGQVRGRAERASSHDHEVPLVSPTKAAL